MAAIKFIWPEWNILGLLSINKTQAGVSSAHGPLPDTPAWRLRDPYDNIQLGPDLVHKIASTLHDELSLYFVYKQHKKTLGSLISINLPGKIKPFIQVSVAILYETTQSVIDQGDFM
ncbi:uncharacterized protein LOC126991080 [Eriocheir sinensis]|uniref:uncharacterized protein LOC126991080 n=1 Tax=Eriocheir sinensis TaxID=95602 RepID=UPI0021C63E11|nr:uncharacterized protein LOC126991080 [Eriocheir sinensis]